LLLQVGTVQKMLDLAELDRTQLRDGMAAAENELRSLHTGLISRDFPCTV
jgi:hypothetical protein